MLLKAIPLLFCLLALAFSNCNRSNPKEEVEVSASDPEIENDQAANKEETQPAAQTPQPATTNAALDDGTVEHVDAKNESLVVNEAISLVGEHEPDLDAPETLKQILGEALLLDTVQMPLFEEPNLKKVVIYAPNSTTPYTGWAKTVSKDGKVETLLHVKDGKKVGSKRWDENGKKLP